MPLIQTDRGAGRDRPDVAVRVVPPPVNVAARVYVVLVVRVLRHDRVELRRRAPDIDPGGNRELAGYIERRIVGNLDVVVDAVEHAVAARARVRAQRRRDVGRRRAADRRSVDAAAAAVLDLPGRARPRRFLEAIGDRRGRAGLEAHVVHVPIVVGGPARRRLPKTDPEAAMQRCRRQCVAAREDLAGRAAAREGLERDPSSARAQVLDDEVLARLGPIAERVVAAAHPHGQIHRRGARKVDRIARHGHHAAARVKRMGGRVGRLRAGVGEAS